MLVRLSTPTQELLDYVENKSAASEYAIALYGEWGSGKTYYLEHVLKERLEANGFRMLRISVFGVSDGNEVYERLLAAYCNLNGSKAARLGNDLGKTLFSTLSGLAKKHGLSIAVSAETILSLVKMEKCLVVLDDTERSGMTADVKGLFGLVNEMVENLHWHVLLVRNEPFSLSDGANSTQAEKVIARQIKYTPSLEDLYRSVVKPELGEHPEMGFAVDDAIMAGISASGHINVRSMARSIPVLESALKCDAMREGKYSTEGRRRALLDVAKYTVLANAGARLRSSKDEGDGDKASALENALLINDYMKQEALDVIVLPLYNGQIPTPDAVGKCLEGYLASHYPDSPADAEMAEIYDRMRNLLSMDDSEVAAIANQLSRAINRHEFGPQWITNAWAMNGAIHDLGFEEALPDEQVRSNMENLIHADPVKAYERLEKESLVLSEEDVKNGREDLVRGLLQCAKEAIAEGGTKNADKSEELGPDTGLALTERLREIVASPFPTFELIEPEYVARCFVEGNGVSQSELRQFFHEVLPGKLSRFEDQQALRQWLLRLEESIKQTELPSRMGATRRDRLIADLQQAIDSLPAK